MITTPHLISSSGAVVDVENLSYEVWLDRRMLKSRAWCLPRARCNGCAVGWGWSQVHYGRTPWW